MACSGALYAHFQGHVIVAKAYLCLTSHKAVVGLMFSIVSKDE